MRGGLRTFDLVGVLETRDDSSEVGWDVDLGEAGVELRESEGNKFSKGIIDREGDERLEAHQGVHGLGDREEREGRKGEVSFASSEGATKSEHPPRKQFLEVAKAKEVSEDSTLEKETRSNSLRVSRPSSNTCFQGPI